MIDRIKWWLYEYRRLKRLWVAPEQSAIDLCHLVGIFWLWRHGAKRETKVYPWANERKWYAIDIAITSKLRGVEADGAVHSYNGGRDIVRDQRMGELGWSIMRVTTRDMHERPKWVRRRVRKFLR